jgi:hypothetical protein
MNRGKEKENQSGAIDNRPKSVNRRYRNRALNMREDADA